MARGLLHLDRQVSGPSRGAFLLAVARQRTTTHALCQGRDDRDKSPRASASYTRKQADVAHAADLNH